MTSQLSAEAATSLKTLDCTYVATGAEHVMRARQSGVSLGHALEITKGDRFHTQLVMVAYEKPRYQSFNYQQRAIDTFRDEWHLTCLKMK